MRPSPLHTIPATPYLLWCQAVRSPAAVGVLITSQRLQTSFPLAPGSSGHSVHFFPHCAPDDKGLAPNCAPDVDTHEGGKACYLGNLMLSLRLPGSRDCAPAQVYLPEMGQQSQFFLAASPINAPCACEDPRLRSSLQELSLPPIALQPLYLCPLLSQAPNS